MAQDGLTRRRFLAQAAAAAAVGAWVPLARLGPAAATIPVPPGFPADIPLYQATYENWAQQQRVDDLWTCSPRHAADVVALANWARGAGYRLRARGAMHNWSPITLAVGETAAAKVVLVDTTAGLTGAELVEGGTAVRAEAGLQLEPLLAYLRSHGRGFTSVPATGEPTVGGILAIDGHGAAVPARGERRRAGHTFGSLSNLVIRLEAVAWDAAARRYELRTFERTDPTCTALLTNLGRGFVTAATFRVGALPFLQCESITDVPVNELLGPPDGSAGPRSLARYLDEAGRAEVLWFPFGDRPWLKVWRERPVKPLLSREVAEPYNYPFSDQFPPELQVLAADLVRGNGEATPLFNRMVEAVVEAGLTATASRDLWGPADAVQLYIRSSTLRVEQLGQAVLVRRADVQRALHDVFTLFVERRDAFAARGLYPANMPLEIRASGLDDPGDVAVPGAEAPALSALRPDRRHPDRDTVLWFNPCSLTGTPGVAELQRDLERLVAARLGGYASLRPEWSKNWACTAEGPWRDDAAVRALVEDRPAANRLDALDPHRVFSNPFLDRLLHRSRA
jgi:FAD/FMN-containing dehydrogenase